MQRSRPLPTPSRLAHETRPLRAQRLLAGLSQAELAALAGVSPSTVVSIERGQHPPLARTGRKLARALNLPLQYLAEFCPVGSPASERKASAWLGDTALTLARRHAPALVPTVERMRTLAAP